MLLSFKLRYSILWYYIHSCPCRSVRSCVSLQKEISDLFRKKKRAVSKKMFVDEIMPHLHNVKDLKGKLDQSISDLERIDCPIVFAGKLSYSYSIIYQSIVHKKWNILSTNHVLKFSIKSIMETVFHFIF